MGLINHYVYMQLIPSCQLLLESYIETSFPPRLGGPPFLNTFLKTATAV